MKYSSAHRKPKPFHEAIIEMIQESSSDQLEMIGDLLSRTIIPKGHDEIIAAWRSRCYLTDWEHYDTVCVVNTILRHKEGIEKKKEEVNNPLDCFQFVDEKHP